MVPVDGDGELRSHVDVSPPLPNQERAMPNTSPIDTSTILKKVKLTAADFNNQVKDECDKQGAAGRILAAAFNVADTHVVLVFQRTR